MKKIAVILLTLALLLSGCSATAPSQTQPISGEFTDTKPQQEDNKNLFEQICSFESSL